MRHVGCCLLLLVLVGCGSSRGPYQSTAEVRRDIAKAESLYQEAIVVVASRDWAESERLLREVLSYDLYHGPAHNNLGVILLERGRLYDAAEEFEWARKLLPGHPEPRVNLAITLERGGRHADAIEAAQAALESRPGHLGALKALAWIQVSEGEADLTTLAQLQDIVERAEEPEWRDWAMREKIQLEGRLGR